MTAARMRPVSSTHSTSRQWFLTSDCSASSRSPRWSSQTPPQVHADHGEQGPAPVRLGLSDLPQGG